MKRHNLSKKEIKEIIALYPEAGVLKKDLVELAEDEEKIILVNGSPSFFYSGKDIYPALRLVLKKGAENFPAVFVDKGAIPFVCKGADVMRPGIIEIGDSVKKDAYVVVADQEHKKPLAIGISLFDAVDMKELKNGKAVKSIHRIGDAVWRSY
ncbi:MAG: DUF1947 domain-containing protein [Candidatus Aenigmarchaeota archaeon]|nr:DUF1947 domain-containing protein [Candidatus Aenigmarchaeota archaeon]